MITLNGFTPEQIAEVEKELRLGWERKAVQAEFRRREIAEVNARGSVWRDDWRVTMRMDPVVNLYWKMREGGRVWQDSFHLKYMQKHFPEMFPKQTSYKTMFGYNGGSENGHEKAQEVTKTGTGIAQKVTKGSLLDQHGRALAAA